MNCADLQDLSLGWDLKLKPFVVAGPRRRELSATNTTTSWAKDVGLDARYGLTAGLNLDVTVNTDFAQVEVDEQQVNLTRFGLFFPEKRDFFLENSNAFAMGTGGSFTSTPVQTDLFFSRPLVDLQSRRKRACHRKFVDCSSALTSLQIFAVPAYFLPRSASSTEMSRPGGGQRQSSARATVHHFSLVIAGSAICAGA